MKSLVAILSLLVALVGSNIIRNEGKIRAAELRSDTITPSLKISGGSAARLGEVPYQAGLIITWRSKNTVCGGSLLTANRVLTAAHCWSDGKTQAISMTVVLGSIKLYTGGVRIKTSQVKVHSKYDAVTSLNDIAMVYLPSAVKFSNFIKPIALPSGRELRETFKDQIAFASGYGSKGDGIPVTQNAYLSYVRMQVLENAQCRRSYRYLTPANICIKGMDIKSSCPGDSGGPLALPRNKSLILIGVDSFGTYSCQKGHPTAFTRVSSHINWIKTQL